METIFQSVFTYYYLDMIATTTQSKSFVFFSLGSTFLARQCEARAHLRFRSLSLLRFSLFLHRFVLFVTCVLCVCRTECGDETARGVEEQAAVFDPACGVSGPPLGARFIVLPVHPSPLTAHRRQVLHHQGTLRHARHRRQDAPARPLPLLPRPGEADVWPV